MSLPAPLTGVVPPLVTPLLGPDTLDADGLERLIEDVMAGGVTGLFLLGTTGEGPCLSYRLRRELVDRACRQAGFRVPILVGITDTAFAEMIALARHAADSGAHALVVAPPYYLPPSPEELLAWVERLVAAGPLPVFLYNMPGLCKVRFDLDTVRRLRDVPQIVGLKDSSGEMVLFHRFRELARERPDWSVLIGPEEMLGEAVLLGGHGGVSGGANLHPRLYVAMYEAASRGEVAEVRRLQAEVLRLGRIYRVGRGGAPIIAGLKCALSLRGICSDLPAEPFAPLSEAEREQVRRLVAELDFRLTPRRPAAEAASARPREMATDEHR